MPQVSCCSSQVFCAGRASRLEASEPMEVEELAAAEEAVVATAVVATAVVEAAAAAEAVNRRFKSQEAGWS